MAKRIKIALIILFSCALIVNMSEIYADDFKIQGWTLADEYVQPLNLAYKNNYSVGECKYLTFKNTLGREIKVIICSGSGFGEFFVPPEKNISRGLIPADSDYELTNILNYPAVIERHEFLPLALSVKLDDKTIVFESFENENDLKNFAVAFIKILVN